MNSWFRNSLYLALGLLWLTGCAWLVLHFFFQTRTDFGVTPHPWQPGLLVIHGVVAVITVFLFGWVAGTHVEARLPRAVNRLSGISLIALASLLTLTGFSDYYLTAESLRAAAAVVHEVLGTLAIVPAVAHWVSARRGRAQTCRTLSRQ